MFSEQYDSKVLSASQNYSDINSYSMYSYARYAQVAMSMNVSDINKSTLTKLNPELANFPYCR